MQVSKKICHIFVLMHVAWENKHRLDDFFIMADVSPTFIAISETKLKSNYILNVKSPGFNFIQNPSQTNSCGEGLYINSNLTYQPRNDLNLNNVL